MSAIGKLLDPLLIPFFVGNSLATALWGVTCCQVWQYFLTPSRDSRYIKSMVVFIWLCDTTHQILITSALYGYVVTNYMSPTALIFTPVGTSAQIAMMQIVMTLVQGFYIYKIWKLSEKNLFFVVPIILLALTEIGLAIDNIIIDDRFNMWLQILSAEHVVNPVFATVCTATDLLIASSMCYLLVRNRSEFASTQSLIKKLTIFTFSTNAVTALCAIVTLALIVAYPSQAYFIPVFHSYVRIYTNSFMAALNMRSYFHKRSRSTKGDTINMASLPSGTSGSAVPYAVKSDIESQDLGIYVTRDTHHKIDGAMSPSWQ